MVMQRKEEVEKKFCPLIGKNCISEECMYWTYSDGWNDTSYPSSDNGSKGYCKHIVKMNKR